MPVVRHQLADPAGTPFVVLAEAERRHRETISRFVRRHSWHFLALPTVCLVNGAPVPVKEWAHRKLRKRDDVAFLSRPGRGGMGGGGGSTTKSIIAVVGLIALTAIAPWAAGLVFGAGTTAAGIGAALLVAGGSLLLTRFMQPKSGGQSEQKDDLYSISSGSNQARPLQPIPVGYGRRLATPDLAAPPYSEYQGDDQYLYQLFAIGCGKYDLEEIRIDDTPLWTKAGGLNPSFPNVQLQYCNPGDQVTLFPVNVVTASEVSGQEVKPQNAWIGGFVANAAGTLARELIIDLVWPGGNFDTYQSKLYPVGTQVEAQAAPVDDGGAQIGDWFGILNKTYNLAKNSQIRVTERVGVPPGRYMVRLRTTTPVWQGDPNPYNGGKSTVTNAFNWSALRASIDGPQSFPGVTTLAIKMKADAVLSGLSSRKIGTIATRIIPVWTGTAWAEQATRNPVWAALDIWSNSDYSAGLNLANVDLQTFTTYATYFDGIGHTFDHVFTDPVSVYEAIETALKPGRANPAFIGDRMTMVRDEPRALPRMLFTDREIVRRSLTIERRLLDEEFADGVVVQYLDERVWRLADAPSAPGLVKPASVQVDGITKREQAVGVARYLAAVNNYRRRTVTFQCELEGRMLKRGDLIAVQSELPQTWGQSGRVTAYAAATKTLTLDPAPQWAGSGNHYVEIRRKDGLPFGPVRVTRGVDDGHAAFVGADLAAGEGAQGITITDVLARTPTMELPSFVFSVGQPQTWHGLVTKGTPNGDLMEIEAVIDDPRVYDIDEGDVPPLPSVPTFLNPGLPVVTTLSAQMRQEGTNCMLNVGWEPPAGAATYAAQISYDAGETWQAVFEGSETFFKVLVSPSNLKVRVQPRTVNGLPGPWSVVDVLAPEIEISNSFVRIKLDENDLRSDIDRFITFNPLIQDVADLTGEVHVIADAADGKARAAITQIATVDVKADKALAIFGFDVVAEYDNEGITVSERLTAAADAYGNLVGSWKVSITSAGYISGFEIITATGAPGQVVNEVRVSTDKFLIGPPAAVGAMPEYFFSVAFRNGAQRVSIRGDLVADGTVSANAIQTDSLSAISANIGDVTAGVLRGPNNKMRIELGNERILISD
jgi:hypothetical protein